MISCLPLSVPSFLSLFHALSCLSDLVVKGGGRGDYGLHFRCLTFVIPAFFEFNQHSPKP